MAGDSGTPSHGADIANLKRQVRQFESSQDMSELAGSMGALTRSMEGMLQLFTEAAQELNIENREEETVMDKLAPITKKLDTIIEQNKTIAEGIITISDMIGDMVSSRKSRPEQSFRPAHTPSFSGMPEPNFPPQDRPAPPGQMFPPPGTRPMPSMPFESLQMDEPRKKGLFGRLKK
jgi:hypothetical protein